jgi:hypothetical protein
MNTVSSTIRQCFVRNFILNLFLGLQMHLRKRNFAKPDEPAQQQFGAE